jgi:uncharacterized membrane protein YdbT with pleckstrin-like domain
MDYVKDTLAPGEEIVYAARLSAWPFGWHMSAIFFFILLPLAGVPLWAMLPGGALFLYIYLTFESTELAITNKRIIVKTGVIKRDTSELYLNRVEGVEVQQSLNGRLLNYGTIIIRGVGTEITPVTNISNPLGFRKAFFAAADKMMEDTETSKTARPH